MPTTESPYSPGDYTPGEIKRTLVRIEQTVAAMAGSVMTKAEFDIHMNGLRQQFKIIDDRHTDLVRDFEAERRDRQAVEKERSADKRNMTRLLWGAVVAAAAAVIIPLMLRGVGLS